MLKDGSVIARHNKSILLERQWRIYKCCKGSGHLSKPGLWLKLKGLAWLRWLKNIWRGLTGVHHCLARARADGRSSLQRATKLSRFVMSRRADFQTDRSNWRVWFVMALICGSLEAQSFERCTIERCTIKRFDVKMADLIRMSDLFLVIHIIFVKMTMVVYKALFEHKGSKIIETEFRSRRNKTKQTPLFPVAFQRQIFQMPFSTFEEHFETIIIQIKELW